MEEFKWKIISQTATDAEGNYTMTWRDQDSNIRVTKHNIFPKENYKGDALDAMDYDVLGESYKEMTARVEKEDKN